MPHPLAFFLTAAAALASAASACAETPASPHSVAASALASPLRIAPLSLGVVTFPNGKALSLSVGIGGGAFHHPSDAPSRIWLVTNRGPSIECARARALVGMDAGELCDGDEAARLLPLPGFVPTLYGVDVGAETARIVVTLPLKGRSGRPLTGLSNPLTGAAASRSFDAAGRALPTDPSALDPGAVVKTSDGGFWLADQQANSLVRVGSDGTVERRIVPQGFGSDLGGADYEVVEGLPPALARGQPGRGFQSLAIAPDERYLFAATQRPLAAPGDAAAARSNMVRIVKVDLTGAEPVRQFAYRLDDVSEFRRDAARGPRAGAEVKLTETVMAEGDTLLTLERVDRTTRIFRVSLAGLPPLPLSPRDDPTPPAGDGQPAVEGPSLESLPQEERARSGVAFALKTLLLDGDTVNGLPRRVAGLAMLSATDFVIVSDNESGVDGAEMKMVRLLFPLSVLK